MTAGDFKQGLNLVGLILADGQVNGPSTLAFVGGPTGGTFTPTVTINSAGVSTAAQAYSAGYTAAALQTALQALSNVGAGNATVTGSNGGPFVITFAASLGPVTLTVVNVLTGGTNPTTTVTTAGVSVSPVPASSAVKVATFSLSSVSPQPQVITVAVVPAGQTVDSTRTKLNSYTLNANDVITQDDVLAFAKGAMWETGMAVVLTSSCANGLNYSITGAVSS